MIKAGIIDPVKVIRTALQDAARYISKKNASVPFVRLNDQGCLQSCDAVGQCFPADDNHGGCCFRAPGNEGQNSQPYAADEWNGVLRKIRRRL